MPKGVDAVFHVAGDTSHWSLGDAQQTRVNVDGTRTVAEAALRRGAGRFVLTSSRGASPVYPQTAVLSVTPARWPGRMWRLSIADEQAITICSAASTRPFLKSCNGSAPCWVSRCRGVPFQALSRRQQAACHSGAHT